MFVSGEIFGLGVERDKSLSPFKREVFCKNYLNYIQHKPIKKVKSCPNINIGNLYFRVHPR